MMFRELIAVSSFLTVSTAHFMLEYPHWRGDSFAEGHSQWTFPCANVSETTDLENRTQWPTTGGSLMLHVHHPWALTYVNLGLGTNVSEFGINLVSGFNQTGNGTFCLKEAGKAKLDVLLAKALLNESALDGMQASLQVVQLTNTGASLYNCADITFNSSATVLGDEECKNATGVGGVAIQNADPARATLSAPSSTGAAGILMPARTGRFITIAIALLGALV